MAEVFIGTDLDRDAGLTLAQRLRVQLALLPEDCVLEIQLRRQMAVEMIQTLEAGERAVLAQKQPEQRAEPLSLPEWPEMAQAPDGLRQWLLAALVVFGLLPVAMAGAAWLLWVLQ